MRILLSIFVLLFELTECLDRTKLGKTPPVQKNFDFEKILGRWYVQADVATCSWSGVDEFQDWVVEEIRDNRGVIGRETFRSRTGDCSTVNTRIIPKSDSCGRFLLTDTIGDVITGDQIVVATDYKTFCIEWGCVKKSFDGMKCDDPYITVSTRMPHPQPYTFKIIETILRKVWDVSLRELRRVKHINACLPPLENKGLRYR